MKLTSNTIFITGGGSGIGRGLAEALHERGNQVIIAGRRTENLVETVKANPGMQSVLLDVADRESITKNVAKLIADYPRLNVLINNSGVMHRDNLAGIVEDDVMVSMITTNLMGTIRLTSALIEHLKKQERAAVINVGSALGFVPMTSAAIYSSTKAAIHSYTQSLRYRLRGAGVRVIEIAPPWVQTDLLNSKEEPRALPLPDFIASAMRILETDADEVLVGQSIQLRNATGPDNDVAVTQLNDFLEQP